MLKNLLGGGSKSAEMQAILQQMQEAIARYEKLATGADRTADRFARLGEPIEKATGEVDALVTRLSDLERRFEGMVQLSKLLESLDDRAAKLTHDQQKAETQIASALGDAERVRSIFEDLSHKVDLATELRERLTSFMEVEKPFQELRDLRGFAARADRVDGRNPDALAGAAGAAHRRAEAHGLQDGGARSSSRRAGPRPAGQGASRRRGRAGHPRAGWRAGVRQRGPA